MAASKPTFHMYVISLYHLCRYVFALMLTEHAWARPQFSTKLSAASQTLRRPASQVWYRFDGYLQIRSDIIYSNLQGQEPVGYLSTLACYIAKLAALNDGCSSHSIYYSSCTPQPGVQLITSSVGFVAPSFLHSQLYHTWFYLSSIIFRIWLKFLLASRSNRNHIIPIPTATPAANEPRQDNRIIIH